MWDPPEEGAAKRRKNYLSDTHDKKTHMRCRFLRVAVHIVRFPTYFPQKITHSQDRNVP